MSAIVTAVIAVLGTLLGSAMTHVFQERSTRRTEQASHAEQLRRELLDAYSAYAGALIDFRQAMLYHWFCEHEHVDADNEAEVRARTFELRSKTQHALFQLQLIANDPYLLAQAKEAFDAIGKIDHAPDRDAVIELRDATRDLIDQYVESTRQHMHILRKIEP